MLAQQLHQIAHGGRIGRVAGIHLDSDGTALGGAHQGADHLALAALAVAAVAAGGQGTAAALEVGGGDIVEQQGCVLQVTAGQGALDPGLALAEPVQGGEHFVAGDGSEAEDGAEGGAGGVWGEAAGGGELGGGEQEASHDGSESELAGTGGQPVEEAGQAELLAEAEDGGDVAMGEGAADGDGLVEAAERHAALEQGTDAGHDRGRELGDIGEGPAANALAFAPGLADQDGGRTVAVGDVFNVNGHATYMETDLMS